MAQAAQSDELEGIFGESQICQGQSLVDLREEFGLSSRLLDERALFP
jgi:hypothetical protein